MTNPNYGKTIICVECEEEFIDRSYDGRKFCSLDCYWSWMRKHPENTIKLRCPYPTYGHLGHKHSEKTKRLLSEKLKEWHKTHEHPFKGRKFSARHKRKIKAGLEKHTKAIVEEMEKLKEQGFRCIPVHTDAFKPIPDIIAIKDNFVYAVEVEIDDARTPDYNKYSLPHPYDDVIWIIKKRGEKS